MRTAFAAMILALAVTGVVATHHSTPTRTVMATCQYVTDDGAPPCSHR